MQKLQMTTQEGDNVSVCAINGNFDDAQSAVKSIFTNAEIKNELAKKNMMFSSANSINWGRLVPQIVYYFSTYCDLINMGKIKAGDKINVVVPTGNFGNILARTSPVTAKVLSSYAPANTTRPYPSMSQNQRVLAEIACDIANMEILRVCWNYVTTQQCPCMDARTRR